MITPYMSLSLPDPSITLGPDWASELNASLEVVDAHNHAPGSGSLVPVAGLNMNEDLSLAGYNTTQARSYRMVNHAAALSESTDLGCLFEAGGELYYRDASGNAVQLTASGALNAASIGGIGGDYTTSTASLAYSSTTKKFTFLQAANTAAIIDCGNIVVRKNTASSNGITIAPATAIAADWTLTLPAAAPASTVLVQIDSSGNMSLSNTVATLETSGDLTIGSIQATSANKVADARTRATGTSVGAGGVAISSTASGNPYTSVSYVDVTGLSVSITTTGRPVIAMLVAVTGNQGICQLRGTAASSGSGQLKCLRGATNVGEYEVAFQTTSGVVNDFQGPGSQVWIDTPTAGTYTYKVQASKGGTISYFEIYAKLVVYEL